MLTSSGMSCLSWKHVKSLQRITAINRGNGMTVVSPEDSRYSIYDRTGTWIPFDFEGNC